MTEEEKITVTSFNYINNFGINMKTCILPEKNQFLLSLVCSL